MANLLGLISNLFELYGLLMIVWAIGSWFPQMTTTAFYSWLESIIRPYINIFRSVIPPIGGFDISVIVAFVALNFIHHFVLVAFSWIL